MNEIQLSRIDLNLLVTFEALMDAQSVSIAAERLGKTPSAVSHALGRLREQLGDPLMVNVGGKMQPSPFALKLIEEVRPLLRTIHRIVQPPQPFEPATSHRVFRIATPPLTPLIGAVATRVNAEAPNVGIDWLSATHAPYAQLIDEEIDIALHVNTGNLPEGIVGEVLEPFRRHVFARRDHPAIDDWTYEAWLYWPHVMVGMAGGARQTVEERVSQLGIERRVGAKIPEFAGVGPLVANTNMISNQTAIVMLDAMRTYSLRVLEPPVDLPEVTFWFFWNARVANDPGNVWIREIVMSCFRDLLRETDEMIAAADVVPVRR